MQYDPVTYGVITYFKTDYDNAMSVIKWIQNYYIQGTLISNQIEAVIVNSAQFDKCNYSFFGGTHLQDFKLVSSFI